MNRKNYGLITAITMITGVVIGSGIFFKSDDILRYTGGNVLLGIVVFVVAAIAIIFGCLTISQLATRTDKPGGLIAYAEEFAGTGVSCIFGWFQTFLYLPALAAVVAWVSGIYLCQLFGLDQTLENWTIIGVINMTLLFVINAISAKLGGALQNAAMLIKLIPLLIIAAAGFFIGRPTDFISTDISGFSAAVGKGSWLSAFAPIAFSFDGWIVSTSISNEIKNSKRNLPIALTVSPFIILVAYIFYFVGMNSLVGPDNIQKQGDVSVFTAANGLFGNLGAKIILIFVVISVLGTVNGVVLGLIRMPFSLALRGMVPGSSRLSRESEKLNGMPLYSAVFSYFLSMFWMVVHYFTQKYGMRGDVSEIAIGISYFNYIVLYIAVIRLALKGEIKSRVMGYAVPVLAIAGSFVIILGSVTNPMFLYYVIICMIVMGAGGAYYRKVGAKSNGGADTIDNIHGKSR